MDRESVLAQLAEVRDPTARARAGLELAGDLEELLPAIRDLVGVAVREMQDEGLTLAEIGVRLGVSEMSVSRYARRSPP